MAQRLAVSTARLPGLALQLMAFRTAHLRRALLNLLTPAAVGHYGRAMDEYVPVVPWSARSPQRYVFAVISVVLGVVVVITAVAYIRSGVGGVVPYLMITVGPVLAAVYLYYFGFRTFEEPAADFDA